MSLKDILVHLTTPSASAPAIAVAIDLARSPGAHVTGLFCYDLVSQFVGINDYLSAQTIADIIRGAEEAEQVQATAVRLAFEDTLRREGILGEWRLVEGNPAAILEQHARYSDLAIFARPDDDNGESDIAEAVLFGSGRPVLVVPPVLPRAFAFKRVTVGWNGAREAARAVSDALPLLRRADKVQVLSVASHPGETKSREIEAEDLCRHLARHGVPVSAMTETGRGMAPEDVLLNAASDAGSDLLVIGGYGHGRFREFVLGGVTRKLMRHATLPVLLAH